MNKTDIILVLIISSMLAHQPSFLHAAEKESADRAAANTGSAKEVDGNADKVEAKTESAKEADKGADKALVKLEFTKEVEEILKKVAKEEALLMEKQPMVSLNLKGLDIVDVLKLLAQKGNLNIVAGKDVRGKVTIFLKDTDVMDALEIILAANGLAYEKEGEIINVMTDKEYEARYGEKFRVRRKVKLIKLEYAKTADVAKALNEVKTTAGKVITDEATNSILLSDVPERVDELEKLAKQLDVPIITKIFSLNYAQAKELEEKVTKALTKGLGNLSIDERTNKMAITDLPKKMEELEKIIAAYDEKHREVLIDAKIYQIKLSDDYKQGVDWNLILKTAMFTKTGIIDLTQAFNVLSTTDPGGRLKVTVGPIGSLDFDGVVQLLNKIGKTDLLSSPHITALNNQEAKIMVGTTEPYVTQTVTTTAAGPTVTAESVIFLDVGVKLFVTPTINKDNFITMKIRPEVSSVTGYLTTSEKNEIPIVDTSTAETTVMVKDGTTILLAGLIKDEQIDTIDKVPILGDIPIIRAAFRKRHLDIDKSELVILLTPRIITGDQDVVPLSAVRPDAKPIPKTVERLF